MSDIVEQAESVMKHTHPLRLVRKARIFQVLSMRVRAPVQQGVPEEAAEDAQVHMRKGHAYAH